MISNDEACRYIQAELPGIHPAVQDGDSIYTTIQTVREYALKQARERNYNLLNKCFDLVASLYEKGTGTVRCAVENVFVYSISRLLNMVPEDKQKIKMLIPDSLHTLYMNQVLHRGY